MKNDPGRYDLRKEYKIEENPYEYLVIDITNRCNMACNFCYNPDRTAPDMSLDYFKYICAKLPYPVAIKLCGGEPTLHPQLLDFIREGDKCMHRIHVVSNGTRFCDKDFMGSLKELKKAGSAFSLGLSMDGGLTNTKAYEAINGCDCRDRKIAAFDSLISHKLGRVGLAAIIIRGLNEDVIPQLIELAKRNPAVRYLHFRNAARVGTSAETVPYSIAELKELSRRNFTEDEFRQSCLWEPNCPPESGRECCYRFRPTKRLQISIIEFCSERASACPRRGRIVSGSDKILPFFESMK